MNESLQLTTNEVCPYLHDREARLRVSLVGHLSSAEYGELLAAGWRRFGRFVFRPGCSRCQECTAIRVAVKRFKPSRSQRRVLRRNEDVELQVGTPCVDDERISLHRRFHAERAETRGWPPVSIDLEEYIDTFLDNACRTLEFRYRLADRLVAIAYVGEAADALNSIYAFYDPDVKKRSIGTLDILAEIAEAARLGKRYLYLGYYVRECPSMAYKISFRPHELLQDLDNGDWA